MSYGSPHGAYVCQWIDETGSAFQVLPDSLSALGIERADWNDHVYDQFNADLAERIRPANPGERKAPYPPRFIDSRVQYAILNNQVTEWRVKDAYWADFAAWAATKGYPADREAGMFLSMSIWGSHLLPPKPESADQPAAI